MSGPKIIPVDPTELVALTFAVKGVQYNIGVMHGTIGVRRVTDQGTEQLFELEIPELSDEE